MPSTPVPEAVRLFLFERIHNYEELEIVVLLQRSLHERWTAGSVADSLAIPAGLANDALNALAARGIVAAVESQGTMGYHWAPSEALADTVRQLVVLYEQYRIDLVMLMSANAMERMRTGTMRAFADAFIVGKRDKNG